MTPAATHGCTGRPSATPTHTAANPRTAADRFGARPPLVGPVAYPGNPHAQLMPPPRPQRPRDNGMSIWVPVSQSFVGFS